MNASSKIPFDEEIDQQFSPANVSEVFVWTNPVKAARRQIHRLIETGTGRHERKAMIIIGPTGIGKTMLLNHVFADDKWQSVRRPEGLVSPIVRIDARPNSTTKGIAELLLQELGDVKPSRGTEHDMIGRVIKLLRQQKTQLVIIDEAQCLASRAFAASDLVKHLLNQASCPVLLVGLEPTNELRVRNRQFRRRSFPTIKLLAFDYTNKIHREQWRGLLKKLQQDVPELGSAIDLAERTISAALNFASRGLLGELAMLIEEALDVAIELGTTVGAKELAEAFERRRSDETLDVINPFLEELPAEWKVASLSEGTDEAKPRVRRTAE